MAERWTRNPLGGKDLATGESMLAEGAEDPEHDRMAADRTRSRSPREGRSLQLVWLGWCLTACK